MPRYCILAPARWRRIGGHITRGNRRRGLSMRISMRTAVFALVCIALLSAAAASENVGWPREIKAKEGKLVIYQPQLDRFEGNILEGRAAVSLTPKGGKEPVFGAFWFKAKLETDFDTRMAKLVSIEVPQVKWADATPEKQKQVGAFLERE